MLQRGFRYSAAGAIFYLFSVLALWLIYSANMEAHVDDGIYSTKEAYSLVLKMAAITTALSIAAIISSKLLFRKTSLLRTAVQCGIATGVVLGAYTILNVLWRDSWSPSSGRPAFLPLWGNVNGSFFYEYNWLSYLLFLTPAAMIAATVLTWIACHREA